MIAILDPLGAVLSFITTMLYVRANKYAWPIGLTAICINAYLYLHRGIYADASLEAIYFCMTFYGWHCWVSGGENKTELPISSLDKKHCAESFVYRYNWHHNIKPCFTYTNRFDHNFPRRDNNSIKSNRPMAHLQKDTAMLASMVYRRCHVYNNVFQQSDPHAQLRTFYLFSLSRNGLLSLACFAK